MITQEDKLKILHKLSKKKAEIKSLEITPSNVIDSDYDRYTIIFIIPKKKKKK